MVEILLCVLICAIFALTVLNMALYRRLTAHDAEAALDRDVAAAMAEAQEAVPIKVPDAAAAERNRMDEGVENIMTYQVRLGRGVVSGGEP